MKFWAYVLAAFTQGDIPGPHFCWRLSRLQSHIAAYILRKTERDIIKM